MCERIVMDRMGKGGRRGSRPARTPVLASTRILAGLVAASSAGTAGAGVINVYSDESIQGAIEAPTTLDGDIIVVAPGTYYETLNFSGRAVTVRSTDPGDAAVVASTIIDGGGAGSVVTCWQGEGPDTVLAGFTIRGGSGDSGGGMLIDASSPTVLQCTFTGNDALFEGGGVFCAFGDPRFINCRFIDNTAFFGGGLSSLGSSPTLTNCLFLGNTAIATGGGIDIFNGGAPSASGCVLTANAAEQGGGIANADGEPSFMNTIVWSNAADFAPEVLTVGQSDLRFSHSDVAGSGGSGAWSAAFGHDDGGNIDSDPMFMNATGADGMAGTLDDDLHLQPGSPCVDAGSNDDLPDDLGDLDGDGDRDEELPLDLDGNTRRTDQTDTPDTGTGTSPVVDMGPYEMAASTCTWDLSGDGRVDRTDLIMLLKSPGPFDFYDLVGLLSSWGSCDDDNERRRFHRRKHRRSRGHRRCR